MRESVINPTTLMKLGQAIKDKRELMDLNQTELALMTGLRQATISDIERGRNSETKSILAVLIVLKGTIDITWEKNPSKEDIIEPIEG